MTAQMDKSAAQQDVGQAVKTESQNNNVAHDNEIGIKCFQLTINLIQN